MASGYGSAPVVEDEVDFEGLAQGLQVTGR